MKLTKILTRQFSQKAEITILDYQSDIMAPNRDLRKQIEASYGPQGLGICLITNIPSYSQKRQAILSQAQLLGQLPKDKLSLLERPEVMHQVGWSCGVEQFKGKPDYSKGSFYANPVEQQVSQEILEQERLQGITTKASNIWPHNDLPHFQQHFLSMGSMVHQVGLQLATHLDYYVESNCSTYEKGTMKRIVGNKQGVIGRLLHYFPQNAQQVQQNTDDEASWCGWHNDHSALTGLTSAIYIDKNSQKPIQISQPNTGLFAKNRQSDMQQIAIPANCLAFQLGESSQILSGGILEATPHCVRGGSLVNVSRNTMAVFMGPEHQELMKVPTGIDPKQALSKGAHKIPALEGRWNNGDTFQQLHVNTLQAYHSTQ